MHFAFVAKAVMMIISLAVTLTCYKKFNLVKCYPKAAVAADAGDCSVIGRDILKRNGSAVDAAIAALLCLSVVNPQSMGIGGGVVFTIYNATTGKVETINARETAPKSSLQIMRTENMSCKNKSSGLLIAVPGELRGYEMAYNRHKRLPWEDLFKPSINLAQNGFKIGKALATAIGNNLKKILKNRALREVFCDSNNNPLKEGDTIKFPKLAETYKKIAKEGADAFYKGCLTTKIVNDIQHAGGSITRQDLEEYQPVLNEYALNFTVGNYIVHAPDAPFGGPVLALILNVLKGYKMSSCNVSKENKVLTFHHIIEAFHFADVEKNALGDPLYKNLTKIIQNMTSDSFADYIRSKIKDNNKQGSYGNSTLDEDVGTSHLSIIDEDGNAVAVTSSINDPFGSVVMSRSTGIIFNNQMKDFSDSSTTGHNRHNLIEPGKRPLSSMCPTIIMEKGSKRVKMVVGASGGTNITTSVAQVILNYLFFDYDLKKAIDEPRVYIAQNETFVEKGFADDVIKDLNQKNHNLTTDYETISVVQAVVRQGDKICAESDYRKGGYPAGY